MYQSLWWSQGLGHYAARTGTVGGSFDSRRAKAGSLGPPDLFAEHQLRAQIGSLLEVLDGEI